jgi:hypothetical protein
MNQSFTAGTSTSMSLGLNPTVGYGCGASSPAMSGMMNMGLQSSTNWPQQHFQQSPHSLQQQQASYMMGLGAPQSAVGLMQYPQPMMGGGMNPAMNFNMGVGVGMGNMPAATGAQVMFPESEELPSHPPPPPPPSI